jgi:S1-C subfamily serine protease
LINHVNSGIIYRVMYMKKQIIAFLLGILITLPVGAFAATKIISASFTANGVVINGQRIETQVAAIKADGEQWAKTYASFKDIAEALDGKAYVENNDIVIDTRTSLEKVVANCKDSCVMIYAYEGENVTMQGSGWVYNGYVITAKHVIEDAANIAVYLDDSINGIPATVYYVDPKLDVAILKADTGMPSITLGDSDKLIEGEKVIGITSPNGAQNFLDECTYTGVEYNSEGDLLGIVDTYMSSGSSGGPIFSYQGELIGMAKNGLPQNIGAIPINDIKPILEKIK